MKSNIELISTVDMTAEQWLAFRHRGLGASDVSTVLGKNPWKSSIALFYEKLGEPSMNSNRLSAFLGSNREGFNADMWKYWDGSEAGMMRNWETGTIVRQCKRINAYAINPKYPWLFVSLDREINKGQRFPGSGRLWEGNGALEIKEIGGYEADKWESGIPIGYIFQHQTQIGVCEYEYGEIAILRDNQEFTVLPFEFNQTIFDAITVRTKVFWYKVLEGRKIMTQRFEAQASFNMALVEELNAKLMALEPEPDGSEAYTDYMKQKYRIAAPGEMVGTAADLETAREDIQLKEAISAMEEKRRYQQNLLRNRLRDGADKITFGKEGYVSWKVDANNSRRFLNKVKPDANV